MITTKQIKYNIGPVGEGIFKQQLVQCSEMDTFQ